MQELIHQECFSRDRFEWTRNAFYRRRRALSHTILRQSDRVLTSTDIVTIFQMIFLNLHLNLHCLGRAFT